MTAAAAYPTPEPRRAPFANASPAEVRAALIPEEAAEFDRDWQEVTARAAATHDRTEMFETLESWRRVAWMTTANGPEAHRRMWRRAAALYTGKDIPADEPLRVTKARLDY